MLTLQRELVAWSEIDIELGVGAVADLRGGIFSGERGQLRGRAEDQGLVVSFVVAGRVGPGSGLRDDLRAAAQEFDDIGIVEDVLIESGEKENLCCASADRRSCLRTAAGGCAA